MRLSGRPRLVRKIKLGFWLFLAIPVQYRVMITIEIADDLFIIFKNKILNYEKGISAAATCYFILVFIQPSDG
jgi:hypothetical protein